MLEVALRTRGLARAEPSSEDVIFWPDGEWCRAEELGGYGWKSDGYERVAAGTPCWQVIVDEGEAPAVKVTPLTP